MYKFVHRMIVLFDTIYIIFNTNSLLWMCQSVVGLFSLRVLKEESSLCACKFGMCFPCLKKKSWFIAFECCKG